MKQKKTIFLLIVLLLPHWILAQTEKAQNSGNFSFFFENDVFAGTDRGYTSGIKLVWTKEFESSQKKLLSEVLPLTKKSDSRRIISISLAQNIYTPDDIERFDVIEEDRPYAGMLYFGLGFHKKNNRWMDTLEINLGIIGPHSYAEDAQKFFHEFTQSAPPNGWSHQLKDELAVEVLFGRKWKYIQLRDGKGFGLNVIPHLGGGLGNVFTYVNTGVQFQLGWNLPGGFSTTLIRPGSDCNLGFFENNDSLSKEKRLGIHVFVVVDGQAVLRNIFLDGNTFRESHRVEKLPLIADISVGIGFRLGRVNISYAYVYWTKQFRSEMKRQVYGAFNFSYSY